MSEISSTAAIQVEQQTTNQASLQLLPEDFRNELFDDNIAFLKSSLGHIYKLVQDHKCKDYRLCVNQDGSPNVLHVPSQRLLYYSEGQMNVNSAIARVEKLPFDMDISPSYVLQYKADWHQRNPIITRMYQTLYDAGPIKVLAEDADRQYFNDTFNPQFIPFLRVYGIGLGYHISQLIQSRDIVSLLVYEPEIDLFYCSLFITPWRLVFQYAQLDPARSLELIVGKRAEDAISIEKKYLTERFPFIQNTRWQLDVFDTPEIKKLKALEKQSYSVSSDGLTAGWYEDQRAGLINALGNIIAGRKVFSGKQVNAFQRIAIVGAGPSLDTCIDYLKQHSDDFIIFACGTAITSLLKNDIVPDYHVHQERRSDAEAVISWAGLDAYKNITALKLNVVDPEVDELYREALIFQKYNDPASALLDQSYPVTKHVNPTVTNTAIAFAGELGANEVYLFGVDYGAPSTAERMHAAHYVHAHRAIEKVDVNSPHKIPGNFGETIISTDKLMFSRNVSEIAIVTYPMIKWFNVGEGARIKGAKALKPEKLPARFKKPIRKSVLHQQIAACFCNNYSAREIIDQLESNHGNSISEYILALRGFLAVSAENRRSIVATLGAMYEAVDIGQGLSNFMPHKLYSGAIKLYIDDVNIQNSMFENEADAIVFFNTAKQVLDDYLTAMQSDTFEIIRAAREQLEPSEQQQPVSS